jgi:hypothetical protein
METQDNDNDPVSQDQDFEFDDNQDNDYYVEFDRSQQQLHISDITPNGSSISAPPEWEGAPHVVLMAKIKIMKGT